VLRKICSSRKVLPSSYELSRHLLPPSEPPKAHGGFCDAYEGAINVKVCIKRLRVVAPGSQAKAKEVWDSHNFPLDNQRPNKYRSYSARRLLCGKI
jgi:hypothetical protein